MDLVGDRSVPLLVGHVAHRETAAEILKFDPDARLVVTSGSVNHDVQLTFLEKGFVGVLPKPYEAGELTQTVYRIVNMMRR